MIAETLVILFFTRDGHIGMHINTDAAVALKQQIEDSKLRRMNAHDLLAGL